MNEDVSALRERIADLERTQSGLGWYIAGLEAELERIRSVIEIAGLGAWDWDLRTDMVWCSPRWMAKLGYTLPEPRCRREAFLRQVHPEDRDFVAREMARAASNPDQRLDHTFRWKSASGADVWVLVRFEGIVDAERGAHRVAGVLVDVTEAKASEAALKAAADRDAIAQARLRTILDVMPVGISITDAAGQALEANQIARELWRTNRLAEGLEEFAHFRGWTTKGEPIAAEGWPAARSLLRGETVLDEEIDIEAFDGERKTLLVASAPFLDSSGAIAGSVCAMVDITAHKLSETQLRDQRDLLRMAMDAARMGVWELDPKSGLIALSESLAAILGIDGESISWDRFLGRIPEADRDAVASQLTGMASDAVHRSVEFRFERTDQQTRWILARGRQKLDAEGSLIRVTGVATDVTELREHEAERQLLEQRIQEAKRMESLGVLAGGIAHDFNNLLASILGNAGMISRTGPATAAANYARDIEETALRAAELVQQMLAYSGRATLRTSAVQLDHLVTAVLSSRSDRHRIDCELTSPPLVSVDPEQFKRAIGELLANAREAVGDGAAHVQIRTGSEGERAFVEVKDEGPGMSPDVLARVFDPFFSTKFPGRGLGLAAALGLARQHGGGIDAKSAPGEGSTFRLWLPVGGNGS